MPLGNFKIKLPETITGKSQSGTPQTQSSTTVTTNDNCDSLDTEDIDEVDDQGQSILMGIITQLKPGMDLTRITLPTFILERKSMLERITNQLQEPDMIIKAHSEQEPKDRFLNVVKWYLSGWHIAPKAVKKPLNPVLGEFFTSYWELKDGQHAYYISEQTSHHPPKSSYFYMIPESNIRVDGMVVPKSKFLGNSSAAIMEGKTVLQFLDILDSNGQPEKYTLTQPSIYARGILFGKMRIELGDHMIIKCPSTGYSIDIEFKTKGFISGTYDAIEGTVMSPTNKPLFEISGKWNDVMYIKDLSTGKKTEFLNVNVTQPLKPQVRPLEEQGDFESRRLWKKVTDALSQRNHEVATDEKFKIEDEQRIRAKKREEDAVEFHPKLFKRNDDANDEMEFVLYKHIPNDADAKTKTKLILETAPILPGQEFTKEFEIPAFNKLHISDPPSQ